MFYWVRKLRFLLLFIITLLFCLFNAIGADSAYTQPIRYLFIFLFLISMLVINKEEKKILIWIAAIIAIKLSLIILNYWITVATFTIIQYIIAIGFFLVLMVATLKRTLMDRSISVTTLFGSLSGYLFLGLVFAYLYLLVFALFPKSFVGLSHYAEARAIYYSFGTMTTAGTGVIHSTHPVIQTLTWIEAFFAQAYIAVFISLLVGRYIATHIGRR